MLANSRMLSRRNLIVVAAFAIFACTLLLTSHRLNGPLSLDYSGLGGKQQRPEPSPGSQTRPHTSASKNASGHASTSAAAATHAATMTVGVPHGSDSPQPNPQETLQTASVKPGCENFPDMSNILVILKTGASEAYNRIPTQLMTNLKCVPHYEIWSDMEQDIASQHIFDALTDVIPEIKAHKDFEIYHHQAQCPIDQEDCNKNFEDLGKKGWALDKYKNIHIAETNWAKNQSQYDWFFYIDADTYVSWPTLVEWFKRLDPSKPAYFGTVALLGGFPFGHGGSGYAVSNAGMKKMFDGKQKVANKYDVSASETCCGDYMFAYAIKQEAELDIQNMFPTINGEKPYTMPFYDGHWCQPITTMHHATTEEIDELDKFERGRHFKSPVLIKDIFHDLVKPKLRNDLDDWNNKSDDEYYFDPMSRQFDEDEQRLRKDDTKYNEAEKNAHNSFEHCRAACESLPACVQFRFGNGICGTATAVRFGKPDDAPSDAKRKSGWLVQRIIEWAKKHEDCGKTEFPTLAKNGKVA